MQDQDSIYFIHYFGTRKLQNLLFYQSTHLCFINNINRMKSKLIIRNGACFLTDNLHG